MKSNATTKHVYDEKQQVEIINKFKRETATFDKVMKLVFLGVSVALSTAAIFVVARMEEKNPQKSLQQFANRERNKDLEFFRHWFIVIVGVICITYGSLFVKRFNPERDWQKWLTTPSSMKRYSSSSSKPTTKRDDDDDENFDEEEEYIIKNSFQNSSLRYTFLQKYGCSFVAVALLCIQLLFLASDKTQSMEDRWSYHNLFYHCSSSFLAVAHALCWPFLLHQMSCAQSDIKLLVEKKYQISDA